MKCTHNNWQTFKTRTKKETKHWCEHALVARWAKLKETHFSKEWNPQEKQTFIDLRKCFSSPLRKPQSHPPSPVLCPSLGSDPVLLQSEFIEIVQRLFASPLCIYFPSCARCDSPPTWQVCLAFVSRCSGSPTPPPHPTLSFSFSLLCFLLLGSAADLTI